MAALTGRQTAPGPDTPGRDAAGHTATATGNSAGQSGNPPATATGRHGRVSGQRPATDADSARPDVRPVSGQVSGLASGLSSGQMAAEWPSNWPRPADPDADTIADTIGWIEGKALSASESASGPVPLLGTAAWCALADNDPARWAAVCSAAAAWFREYVTSSDRIRAEFREELARFELYADQREQAEESERRAMRRQIVKDLCADVDRRARAAARTDLPNLSGPELIAAAHASWGLAPPVPEYVPEVRTPGVPAAGQPASPGTIRRAA